MITVGARVRCSHWPEGQTGYVTKLMHGGTRASVQIIYLGTTRNVRTDQLVALDRPSQRRGYAENLERGAA